MTLRPAPLVVLDTCVLLRLGLMQFLLGVAANRAFLPRWSGEIRREFDEKLPQRRPEPIRSKLARALDAVQDSELDVTDDDREKASGGSDEDDLHVLAAGLAARRLVEDDPGRWAGTSVYLVTENIAHFNESFAAQRGVQVMGPDAFGLELLAQSAAAVLRTVDREPTERYELYLQKMRNDGMAECANEIQRLLDELRP